MKNRVTILNPVRMRNFSDCKICEMFIYENGVGAYMKVESGKAVALSTGMLYSVTNSARLIPVKSIRLDAS